MKFTNFSIIVLYFLSQIAWYSVISQSTSDDSNLQDDWSYCFEFTWFGPGYDNFTTYNGTCADYLDDTRAVNIPCSAPIVITYDSTPPDIDYLWENHRASVLCKRAKNQVCVKYSYIYNGEVNNATYMCTKVLGDSGAVTGGCYTTTYDGYTIEMCVCESTPGIYKPCNGTIINTISIFLLFLALFVTCRCY